MKTTGIIAVALCLLGGTSAAYYWWDRTVNHASAWVVNHKKHRIEEQILRYRSPHPLNLLADIKLLIKERSFDLPGLMCHRVFESSEPKSAM